MPAYSKVMIGLGVVLIVLGFITWAVWGFSARAATAFVAPGIAGLLMFVMAWLSSQPGGAAKSFGIHGGFVLALIYAVVFGMLSYRRLAPPADPEATPPPVSVGLIIGAMALISLITFVLLLSMRPKPEQRGAP